MKYLFIIVLSLTALLANAQSKKFYRSGDQFVIEDVGTGNTVSYPYSKVDVTDNDTKVRVIISGQGVDYALSNFLNQSGTVYSSVSAILAVKAYIASAATATGTSSGTSTVTITPVTPTTGTDGIITSSTSGTITTGALFISIANVGNAVGTVNSINIPVGATITYPAITNYLHNAIPYNATGTSFLIISTR